MTRAFTQDFVPALCTLPGRDWLRSCGIRSRTLRVHEIVAKGYVENYFVGAAGDGLFDTGRANPEIG